MKRSALLFITTAFILLLGFVACQKTPPAELSVSQNDYSVESGGGSVNVNVSTNVDLTVRISDGWITQAGGPSSGSGTYSFTVAHNDGYDARTATITFSNGEQSVSETVTITQAQQDAIIPGSLEYKLFYESQTLSLPVSSNVDYTVSVSGGDWIKSIGTRGLTSKELQFSIAENSGKATREAVVTITSGSLKQSIKVEQLPTTHRPETKEEWKESFKMIQSIAEGTKQIPELKKKDPSTGQWDVETVIEKLLALDDVLYAVPDKAGKNIFIMQRDSSIYPIVLEFDEVDDFDYETGSSSFVFQNQSATQTKSEADLCDRRMISPNSSSKRVLFMSPFQSKLIVDGVNEGSFNVDIDRVKKDLFSVGYDDEHIDYYQDNQVVLSKFFCDNWSEYDLVIIRSHGGLWYKNYQKDPNTGEWIRDSEGNLIALSDPYTVICLRYDGTDDLSFLVDDYSREYYETVKPYIHGSNPGIAIGREWYEATSSKRLPNTIIIPLACHTFETWDDSINQEVEDSFDFFRKNGVIAYCGFRGTTTHRNSNNTLYDLMSSLAKGMNFKDAVNNAQNIPDNFDYDCADDAFLTDPTPFNLNQSFRANTAVLTWETNKTAGEYSFELHLNDDVFNSNSKRYVVNITPGKEFTWYVVANLIVDNKIIASYKSGDTTFTAEKGPDYLDITTTSAKSVSAQGALIPVSYETDWNPNIVERGVVYSSTREMPETRFSDCQTRISSGSGNNFQVQLTGLTPGTTYYARGYVSVEDKEACTLYYGNVVEFTTESQSSGRVSVRVDPTSITFKDTKVGDSSVESFSIINDGDVPLTKVGAYTSGRGPFDFDNQTDGVILYPGQKVQVFVRFTPQTEGEFSTTIVVAAITDVLDAPEIDIVVTGRGIKNSSQGTNGGGESKGPMITLARSEIDYGTVTVGAAVSTGLIITNSGDEVLKLTKVSLVEGNNYFSMPFESNYQGKEIAPGASTNITVKFNPAKAGEYTDLLMIKSNAANYSSNLVILKGKATN